MDADYEKLSLDRPVPSLSFSPEYFTGDQQIMLSKAARARHDAPEVRALFGGRERIYLRLKSGTDGRIRERIEAALQGRGYIVKDYKGGYATDAQGKQTYRIGKLLKDDAALQKAFMDDPARGADDLMIVISRHPGDIARMSAGRHWESCMAAHDPLPWNHMFRSNNFSYVPEDIRRGTLIAYLVRDQDPDIDRPLSRIVIKPYREKRPGDAALRRASDPARRAVMPLACAFRRAAVGFFQRALDFLRGGRARLFVPGQPYGLRNEFFAAAVSKFVADNLTCTADGAFTLMPGLYCDDRVSAEGTGEIVKRGRSVAVAVSA